MNPFTVTLTHPQAALIFAALDAHVKTVQAQANDLIRYIDGEFAKANPNLSAAFAHGVDATKDEAATEQPAND